MCAIFGSLPYILKFHHYLIEVVLINGIYNFRYSVTGYEYKKAFKRSTGKSLNKRAILSGIQYTLLNKYFNLALSIPKITPTIKVLCVLSLESCLLFLYSIIISLKEFLYIEFIIPDILLNVQSYSWLFLVSVSLITWKGSLLSLKYVWMNELIIKPSSWLLSFFIREKIWHPSCF